jgi:hypothetical protein
MSGWLSLNDRPAIGLVPLPEVDVLSQLNRAEGRIQRFRLRMNREDIPKVKSYSKSVFDALTAASSPSPHGNDVEISWSSRSAGRAAFSRDMASHIQDLFSIYPDFLSAVVEIEGEKPINLKRSVVATRSLVTLEDSKKVGPSHAAGALAEAYSREFQSITSANQALRKLV